ncbi:YeiH family protein [Propionibacteriaceae bacterium Y1923]
MNSPATVSSPVPGLVLAVLGGGLGLLVHWWFPGVQAGTVAVVLGAVLVNLGLLPEWAGPGLGVAAKQLLRLAVVLLGFALSLREVAQLGGPGLLVVLVTVVCAFTGTLLLARALKLPRATGLLVATGFSICGASAIAAMEPMARGKKDDTAVAVSLVTLCGTLAIVVLPLLRLPLGLVEPATFGQWVGASVHDVGQTVATANTVPGALESAVIVKLTRVVLLAPMVFGVGLYLRRRWQHEPGDEAARKPPLVPLFVVGFLAAILVNSLVALPQGFLQVAHTSQEVLLTVALFALGTTIRWQVMRRAGGRALVLGLLAWLLVASVAYLGVRMIS